MKLKLNYKLIKIDGESILFPAGDDAIRLGSSSVILLNDTGLFLWKLIPAARSEDDLVEALLEEYEIDRQTASEDVHAFLSRLQAEGIL